MDNRIPESALVYDVHAYPDIHIPKDALLVLLILAGMVQKDAVQELLSVDVGHCVQLDRVFAVATQSCLFFCVPAR